MEPDLECRKARPRVAKYLKGLGLDLGGGAEPITSNALVVDLGCPTATFMHDLGSPGALRPFADGSMDFVFSAFTLNEIVDPKMALGEWWRVLKNGGRLILYLPHKALYPLPGKEGASPRHRHAWDSSDILAAIPGGYQIEENTICDKDQEYAFLLVLRKIVGIEGIFKMMPRYDTRPRACVFRAGGWGDCLMAIPVLRELKAQGYHVTFYTQKQGAEVMRHEPSIDELVELFEDQINPYLLGDFLARLSTHFDRFINLSQTCERVLLFRGKGGKHFEDSDEPQDAQYALPYEERHKIADRNYQEYVNEISGLPNLSPVPQPMVLTEHDRGMGALIREDHKDNFLVLLSLGGSSNHKLFVRAKEFVHRFLAACPRARFITSGDIGKQMLEWKQAGVANRCGLMPFRSSAIVASVADLVVTPETGLAWVAAGFKTSQIVLLSHSSVQNLTKHWANTVSILPTVPCAPCHQIHNTPMDCVTDDAHLLPQGPTPIPICASRLDMDALMSAATLRYEAWLAGWIEAQDTLVPQNGRLQAALVTA